MLDTQTQRHGDITAHDVLFWDPKHGRCGRSKPHINDVHQHDVVRNRSGCCRNPESNERHSAVEGIHRRSNSALEISQFKPEAYT